jgi:hypothetical protein
VKSNRDNSCTDSDTWDRAGAGLRGNRDRKGKGNRSCADRENTIRD